MREELEKKYQELIEKYQIGNSQSNDNINTIIRESIRTFIKQCKNVAIWCCGTHTKILMSDFMNELRCVKFIIDRTKECSDESGFEFITEKQIREKEIDGVIISSYKFKDEIVDILKRYYQDINYLDFYEVLNEKGICLNASYYLHNHPYSRYLNINEMQRDLCFKPYNKLRESDYKKLIGEYVAMKDFRTAIEHAKKMYEILPNVENKAFLEDLKEIYFSELNVAENILEDHVLMLCIDGLRRTDVLDNLMPNLLSFIENKTCFYKNAYSSSTSTYESLIPTYSGNNNLRSKCYELIPIPEERCQFIQEAKKQGRKIYFYTDSGNYINSSSIIENRKFQTATEKIWDFIIDASNEENGLFYIHILYESHFSYPNPYTDKKLIADGTNVMFDFLKRNGGKLRTDYNKQHQDALQYLDDVVIPFLDRLNCRMVIYADHGNIIPDQYADIGAIEETKYTFHEDLIQVPIAIKSPECGIGLEENLVSLMSLNDMIISLMRKEKYIEKINDFVKVQRSEIYNPDFRFIYKKNGYEHNLLAFEVFLFRDGYKMAVFADGKVELFVYPNEIKIEDMHLKRHLFYKIREALTVCDIGQVKL